VQPAFDIKDMALLQLSLVGTWALAHPKKQVIVTLKIKRVNIFIQ
jgi:hypothetical protein